MIDRGKQSVLGVRIDAVDYAAVTNRVIDAARERRPLAVSALAVHGLMTGVLDKTHRYRLNAFDLLVPDGQPVRWALNSLYGAGLRDRVYGPQLMLDVCRHAADEQLPIYFYGNRADVLGDLCANLRRQLPTLAIAGTQPSKFRSLNAAERDELVRSIQASGARIVFVGLGCPRQEVFAYEMRGVLSMPLVAVGAAFNFHAGRLAQAPAALQRCGLEWAFRLAVEPRRLWRRYLLLNPMYLGLLALQAAGVYSIDPNNVQVPSQDVSFG